MKYIREFLLRPRSVLGLVCACHYTKILTASSLPYSDLVLPSLLPTSGASVKVGLRWRRDNLLIRALSKKRLSKSRNLLFEMHMEMTGNKIINSYLTLAQQVYLNNLFTFINLINAVSHLQLLKVLTVNIYFPGRFIDQTTNN